MRISTEVLMYWRTRGRSDAARGRNALMWPTANGGTFFDIDPGPDWDYSDAESREIAKAYYEGHCSYEAP